MKENKTLLEKGDCVELIAPGFSCETKNLIKGIQLLESWGLKVNVPKPLFKKDLICSAPVELRWQHLKAALHSKDSKVIWCVRGGYGSIHLLDYLKKMKKPNNPKLIIGYSDISSLQCFVRSEWGWPTLHGSLVDGLGTEKPNKSSIKYLKKLMLKDSSGITFKGLRPLNQKSKVKSVINSSIVGGNLSVLQSTLGTPFQENLKGKILFLEDLGERAYRVDKMLIHMQQAEYLRGVKAVLLGDFTGGDEPRGPSLVSRFLKQWSQEQNIPVLSGMPCGHGEKQYPLPMGTSCELKLGEKTELWVEGF